MIILDTLRTCQLFLLVVFVSRSSNNVAHSLAQAAYSLHGPMELINITPDFISCNLMLDAI